MCQQLRKKQNININIDKTFKYNINIKIPKTYKKSFEHTYDSPKSNI